MFKKIAVRVLMIAGFIMLIDFIAGMLLKHYYFRQTSGYLYRTTYAMDSTTADVLIFGSSRANHHYHPDLFQKRLEYSFYNAGRDGCSIFYHYAVLRSVLKRYTPKIVILDFTRGEFDLRQENYDRLSCLLPYYRNHPEIRSVVELKSKYEKVKLLFRIYPYNSLLLSIAIGNMELNKKRSEDIKGYVPLTRELTEPLPVDTTAWTTQIDSTKLKIYSKFIDECKQKKISVFVICSPYYLRFTKPDASIQIASQIAKEHNVRFFNFSALDVFNRQPACFSDRDHLNEKGSRLFSNIALDSIQGGKTANNIMGNSHANQQ